MYNNKKPSTPLTYIIIGIIVGFFIFFKVAGDYGTIAGLVVAGVIAIVITITGCFLCKSEKNNDSNFDKKFEEFKLKRGDIAPDDNSSEAQQLQLEHAYKLNEYRDKYNPNMQKKHKTLKAELLRLTQGSKFFTALMFMLAMGAIWLTISYKHDPFFYNILFWVGGLVFLFFSLNNIFGFYIDKFFEKLKAQKVDIKELERDFMDGKLFYGKRKTKDSGNTELGLNIGKEYTIGFNAVGNRLILIRNSEVKDVTRYVVNEKHYLNGAYSHSEIDYRIRIIMDNNKIIEIPLPDEYMLDLAIEAFKEVNL